MQLSCIILGIRISLFFNNGNMNQLNKGAITEEKVIRRKSRSREAILRVLSKSIRPLSAVEIGKSVQKFGECFNKTTIYREIEKLKASGEVKELVLRNDSALYEQNREHHHHIVCVSCRVIRDIHVCVVSGEEKRIARQENFDILDHSFELFGLCEKCR